MRAEYVACLALGLVLASPAAPVAAADHTQVRIRLPLEPRLETAGIRRILVGSFLSGDFDRFDLRRELVRGIRTTLRRNSDFLVLDEPPPALPEQKLEDLKSNAAFFAALGAEYEADLIITGEVQYDVLDRSGFVQEEVISPTTGRRTVRSVYLERTGFGLRIDLIFLRGSDGALIYDTRTTQDEIFEGEGADPMNVFFELLERSRDEFLRILTPGERVETRFLFRD